MKGKITSIIVVSLILMSILASANTINSISRSTIYVDDDNTAGPWDGTI